jgi:hypothetical protein
MVALHMHSMHAWFTAMENCKQVFFDPAGKDSFLSSGKTMLASYHWLAGHWLSRNALRWPLRPKMHAVHHILRDVQTDDRCPKRYGTIMDEDFLGKVVKVAAKCHRRTVAAGVMFRYIVNLTRHWSGVGRRRLRIKLRRRLRRRAAHPLPPHL